MWSGRTQPLGTILLVTPDRFVSSPARNIRGSAPHSPPRFISTHEPSLRDDVLMSEDSFLAGDDDDLDTESEYVLNLYPLKERAANQRRHLPRGNGELLRR